LECCARQSTPQWKRCGVCGHLVCPAA
jgi:hypothetical protein